MKITNLDEVYFNPDNLDRHYTKHVESDEDGDRKMPPLSKENYNEIAHILSSSKCGTINSNYDIVGYETAGGRRIKYMKSYELLVAYVDDDDNGHEAISLYKQPFFKFLKRAGGSDVRYKYYKDIDEDTVS